MASKLGRPEELEPALPQPKRRLVVQDDSEDEEPVAQPTGLPVRNADEVVVLKFVTFNGAVLSAGKPEFVHQMFEDSKIAVEPDAVVTVTVNVNTLRSSADAQGCSEAKQQELLSAIRVGLPTPNPEPPLELPTGQLLHSYSAHGNDYTIYHDTYDDEASRELHARAEKLAIWFIETADTIDFSSGYWEVLFLINRTNAAAPEFVGYFTLFTFVNPFKGARIRVCQALILPHEQNRGHGGTLLEQVYKLAMSRRHVGQITVEDPAPGFVRIRNILDTKLCVKSGAFARQLQCQMFQQISDAIVLPTRLVEMAQLAVTDADKESNPFNPDQLPDLPVGERNAIAEKLKLIPGQVALAYEACVYTLLEALDDGGDKQARWKQFRLKVKRRLLAEHPELETVSKQQRIRHLDELYAEMQEQYAAVSKSLLKALERSRS